MANNTLNIEDPFDLIMPTHEPVKTSACSPETPGERDSAVKSLHDEPDLLQALHQEYLRALDDPQAQNTHPWHDRLPDHCTVDPSPIRNLKVQAMQIHPSVTLQDLVVGPLKIDEVFTGLDSLRETEIFSDEKPPDLLRLFAPAQYQTRTGSEDRVPPELTRREHHAITVDSHCRMPQHDPATPGGIVHDDLEEHR